MASDDSDTSSGDATPPPPSESDSSSSSTPDSSPPPKSSSSPPPSSPPPSSPPPSSPPPASPPPSKSPPSPPASPPPSESPPSPPPSQSPPTSKSPPPSSSSKSPPSPKEDNSKSPSPPKSSDSSSPTPPSGTFYPPPPPKSGSSTVPSLGPPRSGDGDSPSESRGSKSPPKSHHGSDGGSDTALIVGIAAGVGVFLLILVISAIVCCCCKKKKKNKLAMHYYDPSPLRGNGGGGWQPHGADPNSKIPPPPGIPQVSPTSGGWPPPPPGQYSGDYSSSHSAPQSGSFPQSSSSSISLGFSKSSFTYDELAAATGGFSQANLLGQGGFGYVFKGYLPNGKEVAVKQLKAGSGQGEREFQAEVEIISRVHHRHLVSLVGYCIAGQQRMLVYEFVPNNTLEHHLHGKGLPTMDWPTRVKIAIGSAKGFAYLHEDCHPRIIHRDIKAANILLDYKYEAMVADFGLAKLSLDTNTHVSTRIMGTFGYLAPEYASSGKLTDRSDVFSFGVMLLELITGRRPIDHTTMEDSLVDWARPIMTEALAEGNFSELADPKLNGNYNTMEMARMVACASASVRHSARRRPKMSQIVRALEGDGSLDDLHEGGVKPGQSGAFSSGSEYESSSYSSNMRQFRKTALGSGEYSGDCSTAQTSEYGLNPSESSGSSGEMHSGVRKHKTQQHV